MKEFLTYCVIQIAGYSLLTVNFRSVAHGNLGAALVTDATYATLAFFVIRKIAKSEDSIVGWLGYVCGSLIGTTIGMHI